MKSGLVAFGAILVLLVAAFLVALAVRVSKVRRKVRRQQREQWAKITDVVKDFPDAQVVSVASYQEAQAHNDRGADLLEKDDFDGAIREFHRAIEILPRNAVYVMNWGNALISKGLADRNKRLVLDGIAALESSLRIDPKNERARQNLDRIKASLATL